MTTRLDMTAPEAPKSSWSSIGKLLFIVILVILFFLLGHTMVRHRFFRGGWRNPNGSLGP